MLEACGVLDTCAYMHSNASRNGARRNQPSQKKSVDLVSLAALLTTLAKYNLITPLSTAKLQAEKVAMTHAMYTKNLKQKAFIDVQNRDQQPSWTVSHPIESNISKVVAMLMDQIYLKHVLLH